MKPITWSGVAMGSILAGLVALARADDTHCSNYSAEPKDRKAFFGDLHVHSNYSVDAFVFDVPNGPRDAYDFARGPVDGGTTPATDGQVAMTPIDAFHNPTRTWQLRRPLDFTAVTDHSEGFGLTKVCTTPGTGNLLDPVTQAYDSPECQLLRGVIPLSALPRQLDNLQFMAHKTISQAALLFLIAGVGVVPPNTPLVCRLYPEQCDVGAATIWQDEQDAAQQYYDPCSFTTFVAYEWTAMPATANLHRNVIFKNEHVPGKAISYFESAAKAQSEGKLAFDVRALWEMLQSACIDAGTGCDVLTIPHNSNLSAGLMFPDPHDAKEAADRAVWEPLVEITQHKGSSECRFDSLLGSGVNTRDELCAFEQENSLTLLPNQYVPGSPPPQAFSPRSFVRSVLKAGIKLEKRGFHDPDHAGEKLHINPFKLGVIGSTDTHNGTPGNTDELDWPGHAGNQDDTELKRMSGGFTARGNPGGLAVAWAEENTRDSIFAALRRRETYGTSGTRPIVRFFGGWSYADDLCADPNLVAAGYGQGVPMGSDLPAPPDGATGPKLVVQVMQDPGAPGVPALPGVPARPALPGTPLQRIQIIKGWVDAHGRTHENVLSFDPEKQDGTRKSGESFDAGVDRGTCQATVTGSAELCTVWKDDHFDPREPAFYYARVLEDPTCRWSTYACRKLGIDPFADNCLVQAETAQPGQNLADCCAVRLDPVVQERAWSSPIWYKPSP